MAFICPKKIMIANLMRSTFQRQNWIEIWYIHLRPNIEIGSDICTYDNKEYQIHDFLHFSQLVNFLGKGFAKKQNFDSCC